MLLMVIQFVSFVCFFKTKLFFFLKSKFKLMFKILFKDGAFGYMDIDTKPNEGLA